MLGRMRPSVGGVASHPSPAAKTLPREASSALPSTSTRRGSSPVRPLVGTETTGDDEAAQGDAPLGRGEDLHRLDLGRRDRRPHAGPGGGHGEPKFSVTDAPGAVDDDLTGIVGQLGAEEGVEAGGEPLEVSIELDRPAVEDEHRLEDASGRIGVGRRGHAGIS
jgi:hypothetical protein